MESPHQAKQWPLSGEDILLFSSSQQLPLLGFRPLTLPPAMLVELQRYNLSGVSCRAKYEPAQVPRHR